MWNELKYEQSNERLNTCYFCFMLAGVLDSSNYLKKKVPYYAKSTLPAVSNSLVFAKKDILHLCTHTHTSAWPHVESHWRQQRRSDDPRATSDFLVSPLCYICVTPTHQFSRERKKKEIAFQTYEEHLSARVSLGSAERKEEGAKLKKRQRERDKRGQQQQQQRWWYLHVTCWTISVGTSSANLPGLLPQLLHLTRCPRRTPRRSDG